MASNTVRTRFAPSPTGYMHVGNLRTALYAYLKAKSKGGTFILRIEDTDQGRLVEGAVDVIYDTLRQTGLLWDEGPDVGGPVGPYIQSQRMGMFRQYAEQLVEQGKAYYCFCTAERLEQLHADQKAAGEAVGHYDGHCRDLPPEDFSSPLLGEVYRLLREAAGEGRTPSPALLESRFSPEEMGHLTTVLQKPVSRASAERALADYIRVIRQEADKRRGGVQEDPLLAAKDKFKEKKGYGGKQNG